MLPNATTPAESEHSTNNTYLVQQIFWEILGQPHKAGISYQTAWARIPALLSQTLGAQSCSFQSDRSNTAWGRGATVCLP